MVILTKTDVNDIPFIVGCLENKPYDYAAQCGYGNRFFTFPVTAKQISDFQASRKNSLFFTIYSDKTKVGSFELMTDNAKNECSIARLLIHDDYKNKGYGTETLKIFAKYAFDELKMEKIRLSVYDFNKNALRCYEKAGFVETKRETRENGWVSISMEISRTDS